MNIPTIRIMCACLCALCLSACASAEVPAAAPAVDARPATRTYAIDYVPAPGQENEFWAKLEAMIRTNLEPTDTLMVSRVAGLVTVTAPEPRQGAAAAVIHSLKQERVQFVVGCVRGQGPDGVAHAAQTEARAMTTAECAQWLKTAPTLFRATGAALETHAFQCERGSTPGDAYRVSVTPTVTSDGRIYVDARVFARELLGYSVNPSDEKESAPNYNIKEASTVMVAHAGEVMLITIGEGNKAYTFYIVPQVAKKQQA